MLILRSRHALIDPRRKEQGVQDHVALVIDHGVVQAIIPDTPESLARYPGAQVLGNGRQLLLPGLIDAHSHGRGLSPIQKGVRNDFLENALFDWSAMMVLPPELTSAMCAYRHLRSGCTTLHHNGFDDDVSGAQAANTSVQQYLASGIRLAFSPGLRNESKLALDEFAFFDTLPDDLKEWARPRVFYDKQKLEEGYFELFDQLHARYDNDDTRILLSPSWAHGATPQFLQRCHAESQRRGGVKIHIHTLQSPVQKAYSLRRNGVTAVQWLDDVGFLSEHVVFGHAIHITEADIALMARRGVSITHHPSCNFIMRNGLAPLPQLLEAGVRVAMGMDDKTINDDEDAIMEARMVHKMHRCATYDLRSPAMDAYTALEIATVNGAQVCGFGDQLGTLMPGMKADAVLVDLDQISNDPWLDDRADIIEAFLQRGMGRDVSSVVVGGKVVVQERQFQQLDVEALFREVRDFCARGITDAQRERVAQLQRVKPY
ncbi:MAG: amidohydrolase family protein, partial [Acidovorax sp.]|nr:amidohydrolase family protein [Acidovorax sp.]